MNSPIVVSCFGRAGSSMVMQMLESGGIPITGEWPAFEDGRATEILGNFCEFDLAPLEGMAIKLLDPQAGKIKKREKYPAVWLRRTHVEQAKSQAKFMRIMMGITLHENTLREFERSYSEDYEPALKVLRDSGAEILVLDFETILKTPLVQATAIGTHLSKYGFKFDQHKATLAVRNRGSQCANGLDLELELMRERR